MKRLRGIVAGIAGTIAVVLSFMPVITGERNIAVPAHHFDHGVLMFFGAVVGLALYRARDPLAESPRWIYAAILAPLVAMVLMAPSFYAIVDKAPVLHSFNHLLFAVLGALSAYSGQRYARGVGWATAIGLELMAFAAAFGYGVAPAVALPPHPARTQAATTASVSAPDVTHGKTVFAQNCSSCHGAAGQGGVGPSLRNEDARKNLAQTASWIKHPAPPMPGLYPAVLGEKDVNDVAAFVETLK